MVESAVKLVEVLIKASLSMAMHPSVPEKSGLAMCKKMALPRPGMMGDVL